MLYPLIRVRDNCGSHHERIVGENSHDILYVDKYGGIQYLNCQCMAGTKYADEGYSFIGIDKDYSISGRPEIEMVTLDQLIDMAAEHLEESTKAKIMLYQAMRKHWDEELENCKRATGIDGDTGGVA